MMWLGKSGLILLILAALTIVWGWLAGWPHM